MLGRQQKQTAEYFPHYVDESRTKFILETTGMLFGTNFWKYYAKAMDTITTAQQLRTKCIYVPI